jgi:hypothetical protein
MTRGRLSYGLYLWVIYFFCQFSPSTSIFLFVLICLQNGPSLRGIKFKRQVSRIGQQSQQNVYVSTIKHFLVKVNVRDYSN